MRANRREIYPWWFLSILGTFLLSFCGNNYYHQTSAARILTMDECLECHNGGVGRHVHVCVGAECLFSGSHSVMRKYPPPGKEHLYASISEIQRVGCILENGKVTCLSCHNLTKPPPHLVKEGDDLCRICHIDKARR